MMKLLSTILFFLFLQLTLVELTLYSQNDKDNPLEAFPTQRNTNYIGVFAGLGGNMQSGDYQPNCIECLFSDASGFGYTVGIILNEQFLNNFISIGGALGIDYMEQSGSYRVNQLLRYESLETGDFIFEEGTLRYEAQTSYTSLVFMPYIKFEPTEVMFIRLGASCLFPLSSHVLFTESPTQNTVKDDQGKIYVLEAENPVRDDGEVAEVNSFVLYLSPAIGFNIDLANDIQFSPLFQYNIPMGNISESGNNYQLSSWRLMFEFRIYSSSIF
jgi:hypothetical protein